MSDIDGDIRLLRAMAEAACDKYAKPPVVGSMYGGMILRVLEALAAARCERDEWRNKHDAHVLKAKDWHRRMQQAEAACAAAYENKPRTGGRSLGRALANSAAYHYRTERDAAMALIAAHNAECERLCHRDIKGGRCEAYVSRGRECTDCPRDWVIDETRSILGGDKGA